MATLHKVQKLVNLDAAFLAGTLAPRLVAGAATPGLGRWTVVVTGATPAECTLDFPSGQVLGTAVPDVDGVLQLDSADLQAVLSGKASVEDAGARAVVRLRGGIPALLALVGRLHPREAGEKSGASREFQAAAAPDGAYILKARSGVRLKASRPPRAVAPAVSGSARSVVGTARRGATDPAEFAQLNLAAWLGELAERLVERAGAGAEPLRLENGTVFRGLDAGSPALGPF